MGDVAMKTNVNEFLFTGVTSDAVYGSDYKVNKEKLMQYGQKLASLSKLFYDIQEISLNKDETQAVTLLDGVKGSYENV